MKRGPGEVNQRAASNRARRPQSTLSSQRETTVHIIFSKKIDSAPAAKAPAGGTTGFAKPSMHPHIFYSRLSYLPLAPTAPLCKLRGSGEGTTKDECGAAQQTATQSRTQDTRHQAYRTSAPRPIGRHRRLPPEGRAPAPPRHRERPRRHHRKTPDTAWPRRWPLAPREGRVSRSLQRSTDCG